MPVLRVISIGLLLLVAAGCSGSPPAGLLDEPTPTATPLATSVDVSTTAKPKATPKAKVTPKPAKAGSYYKPKGWDGYSDVDCKDFDTHAHAQSFFTGTGGSTTNDPYRLDANHDGVACETLP